MATSSVALAGASAMAAVEEPTAVEESKAVDKQGSDTSKEAVKVPKPKKATSEKKQQPEKCRRSFRLLQRQCMKEDERQAAHLIRRCRNSFAIYFPKVLRRVHVGFTLSEKSVSILDSFVKDMFERIANEASNLARQNKSSTINSREIQTAVCLLLPGKICKQAVAEGTMALVRYISSK
ncbi:late histone H2B.L4-like [Peromyscus eremicus]|uniref:late histone H2B.L4-like n=1 Tax=Peromyscus eremicus TaxID=42410 RepID=UPI0027DCBEE5|nr:late histone H2B.L4-like [Peromyscus eremicus]